ncbi:MAG TPA: DUF488 family protein [Opitutaceae bacterium]|nr:DUF488 family protein [Opitutaceae bacterium]
MSKLKKAAVGDKPALPKKPAIAIKRAYDAPAASASDGKRFLAERLWPRGIKKEALKLDGWLRDVAPSTALRKWFGHDPARWEEFQRRYRAELDANPEAWQPILDAAKAGPVTLLFSSRDTEHNNVVALRDYLLSKRERRKNSRSSL